MKAFQRVAATGGVVLALGGSALAAGQLAGRAERTPAAAAVTISSSAPLFQETGLVGGQSMERCTVLTNEGPQPADVSLFGRASQADLSPWLQLELVRGALPEGVAAGDCTGFVADDADYGLGAPGVVFRGSLAELPDEAAGIADPARWEVGERHAYRLRIDYSGDDPQQGLTTVQAFAWGVTPFDDRPIEPEPTTPYGEGPIGDGRGGGAGGGGTVADARQCTVVTFPARAYVGARAISRPAELKKRKTKAKAGKAAAGGPTIASSEPAVVAPAELPAAEQARRAALLRRTAAAGAKRTPTLVVRISPRNGKRLDVRVGLRKAGKITAPKRWKWVRVRVNASPARSSLRWPFRSAVSMSQLRTGYNQIDISLHRGGSSRRIKGLPALLRRSFAFRVGDPGAAGGSSTDCTLG